MRDLVVRLVRHGAPVIVGASTIVLTSCAPTAPIPVTRSNKVMAWLDSYAVSGQVRLWWVTASNNNCFDCSPERVRGHVEILLSSVGPFSGYKRIFARDSTGPDSAVASELVDGRT